jgi:hypothetical protein
MLRVDLQMADVPLGETVLLGPETFKQVQREWERYRAINVLIRSLGEPAPASSRFIGGGILTCDCVCHLPLGPGANREGRPEDCVHCRLIAA